MSDRASSDSLSLGLSLLLGPIAALVNQALIYITDMWVCGSGPRLALHVVPALCLSVTVAAGLRAFMHWSAMRRGVEDERGGVDARTRFIALMGIGAASLSGLFILAQWLAVFVFDPCARA